MTSLQRILLASESPRRREMISWLNVPFQVTRVDIKEDSRANELPYDLATRLAVEKARAVNIVDKHIWILAADTIVDSNNKALGKPVDAVQARLMLNKLREGVHHVHTGLAVVHRGTDTLLIRRVTTDVWMRQYTDSEIDAYIASGDPMDKAGAYAVQHPEFHPVHHLDRCYANVVGLPLCALAEILKVAGHTITDDIPELCRFHYNYHCPKPDKGTQV